VRVERGIYLQTNGKYAIYASHAGKAMFAPSLVISLERVSCVACCSQPSDAVKTCRCDLCT
jgi:hypothetical protein